MKRQGRPLFHGLSRIDRATLRRFYTFIIYHNKTHADELKFRWAGWPLPEALRILGEGEGGAAGYSSRLRWIQASARGLS